MQGFESETLGVRATARTPFPVIPFATIKDSVLGARYELSLVFVGDTIARRLNQKHRGKSYVPNVLSFPTSTSEGEIVIKLRVAAREAKQLRTSLKRRVALLFVHGLYHLKGHDHGDAMEAAEQKTLSSFGVA